MDEFFYFGIGVKREDVLSDGKRLLCTWTQHNTRGITSVLSTFRGWGREMGRGWEKVWGMGLRYQPLGET